MNAAPATFAAAARQWIPRQLGLRPGRAKPLEREPLPIRSASFRANLADMLGFLPKLERLGNGWIGTHETAPFRRYACLTPLAVKVLTLLLGDEGIDFRTFEVRTHMRFLAIGTGKTRKALRGALYELEALGFGERLPLDRKARKLGGVWMRFGRFVCRRELQDLAVNAAAQWDAERLQARAEGRRMRRAWPLEGGRISPIGRRGKPGAERVQNEPRISPLLSDPSGDLDLKPSPDLVTPPPSALDRRPDLDRASAMPGEARRIQFPLGSPSDALSARDTDRENNAVPAKPARLPTASPGAGRESRGNESTGRAAPPRPLAALSRPERPKPSTPPPARPGGGSAPARPKDQPTPESLAAIAAFAALLEQPPPAFLQPGWRRTAPPPPDRDLKPANVPDAGPPPPDIPLTSAERAELAAGVARAAELRADAIAAERQETARRARRRPGGAS